MSGSGRQVLLRILSSIESALGPSHAGVQIRQVPGAHLDELTRRYIDEKHPSVALILEPSFNRNPGLSATKIVRHLGDQ